MSFTDAEVEKILKLTTTYLHQKAERRAQAQEETQRVYTSGNKLQQLWHDMKNPGASQLLVAPSLETQLSVIKSVVKKWDHYRIVHKVLLKKLSESMEAPIQDYAHIQRLNELLGSAYKNIEEHRYKVLNTLAILTVDTHEYCNA